jgi:membrane protein YqaA with SNARE-associated domain
MQTLLILMTSTLGGWVGWWLGDLVGTTTAIIVSLVGSGVGWYVGAEINRRYR